MPTLQIFNSFRLKLAKGIINLDTAANGGDTFKVFLSATTPNLSTHDEKGDITEIANGNGYTTGGQSLTITSLSESAGVVSWVITSDLTWTASGGTMASFRYAYIYDDTISGDPLVGVIDHGSTVSLSSGTPYILRTGGVTLLTVD